MAPGTSQLDLSNPGAPLPTGWRAGWALLVLATPIIASMCSRTAMSFVDFVMVSRLGTEAQAAIMPAGVLLFCVISFGAGTLTAVNTFVSQSLGRGDARACGAWGWQGVYLGLGLGLMTLPAWFAVPGLFAWVGHAPAVQEMEVAYVQIGLLGVAPMLVAMALTNFFSGIHRPAVDLWSTVIANVFNGVANYGLIFGHFGLPAMGIAGAAWGTFAASLLQAMILLGWMLRPAAARQFHTRHTWRLDPARLRRLLSLGLPAGVQFVVDIVAFTIFTLLLVGRFGTTQLAAHNLVFKLLELSFMPSVGLGVAVTAAVGKAIGHGRPDYARLITRWGTCMAMGYMGLLGLCYLVMPTTLASLLSDDQGVIGWASHLLAFCAVFQVFDALGIIHVGALRGAGDTRWPAVVGATLASLVLVGGGYLLALRLPGWGAAGPWLAATVYISILGLTMAGRWAWGPWERIELGGEGEELLIANC